jgi:hypothetical protein
LNQKLKRLIRQLGEAIHESVSGSDDIAGVVKDIRDEGFDVLLMLEATIGLNEIEGSTPGDAAEAAGEEIGPFNTHDLNFLKSLRITIEDETPVANESLSDEAVTDDASGESGNEAQSS